MKRLDTIMLATFSFFLIVALSSGLLILRKRTKKKQTRKYRQFEAQKKTYNKLNRQRKLDIETKIAKGRRPFDLQRFESKSLHKDGLVFNYQIRFSSDLL